MGYLSDQQGIAQRYQREVENWEPHLQLTKSFIRQSFLSGKRSSVAILGSGWLLDLPMDHLLERFDIIWLLDIFHPPQVRKNAESIPAIRLVECDLSGGAVEQAWQYSLLKHPPSLEEFTRSLRLIPPLSFQPDAILSLNLLNQLDILLCDYLKRKVFGRKENFSALREKIQSFHIGWIRRFPGVLITDVAEIRRDRLGHEQRISLLHTPFPEGIRQENWLWNFDTSGRYRPGSEISMEVKAVEWT